jgi:hypothetical protein
MTLAPRQTFANDEETPPKTSQASRVVAFTSFVAFAAGFSWIAVSLFR